MSFTAIHVSLDGNDGNPGTEAEPLASIQTAYNRLSVLENSHRSGNIYIHGGVYVLRKPLHFTRNIRVTLQPFGDETVILQGGVPLSGWGTAELNGHPVLRMDLSSLPADFNQVYVNGRLCRAASLPKQGGFKVANHNTRLFPRRNSREGICFRTASDCFNPGWHDPRNIGILMTHYWVDEHLKFASYDAAKREITVQTPFCMLPDADKTEFRFTNVREALTEPGEYYFDRQESTLYYYPHPGETAANTELVIPEAGVLVYIGGQQSGLTLKNLQFRYAGGWDPVLKMNFDLRDPELPAIRNTVDNCGPAWQMRSGRFRQGVQAAMQLPGVLMFDGVSRCTVRECRISHVGWYGICVASGCHDLTFEQNEITGTGGGGIRISGIHHADLVKTGDFSRLTRRLVIRGNEIHHCGVIYPSAPGVFAAHAREMLIEHNHLHHLNYSGISCGWTWGFCETVSCENRISWNLIHDLGGGELSDMGAVYLLGIQPGTRVDHNVICRVRDRNYGGWGIYLDEGSSHIVIEKNLVYDCSSEPFHLHFGRENLLRDNIFAFGGKSCLYNERRSNRLYSCPGQNFSCSLNCLNNVFISDGRPFYSGGKPGVFGREHVLTDCNWFYDLRSEEGCFCSLSNGLRRLERTQWQVLGHDLNSRCGNPGFADLAGRDFRLAPGSALKKKQWKMWNFQLAGVKHESH